MGIIEVTAEWGAEVTICTNSETYDTSDPRLKSETVDDDVMRPAVAKAQDVIFNALGSFADENSSFRDWHGGKLSCAERIKIEWCRRPIAQDTEELEEFGDQPYGKWEWPPLKEVPQILLRGMDSIIEQAVEVRDSMLYP